MDFLLSGGVAHGAVCFAGQTKVLCHFPMPTFSYDANGNSLSKNELFYIPGAGGKVIAVYDAQGTHLYWNLWGQDLIDRWYWER